MLRFFDNSFGFTATPYVYKYTNAIISPIYIQNPVGEEYDKLSDIKDYYYSKDIKFKNLSDLVPYFPYVIGLLCKDPDEFYIVIHHQSEIDEKEKSYRQCGLDISGLEHYREELKKKLIEVILKEREMGLI